MSTPSRSPSAPSGSSRTAPETYSWVPFGGGVRRCLGGAFAEFEMRIVLREVLEPLRAPQGEPGAGADRPPQRHPLAADGTPVIAHRPPPGAPNGSQSRPEGEDPDRLTFWQRRGSAQSS